MVSMNAREFAGYTGSTLSKGYSDISGGNMTTEALVFVSVILFTVVLIIALLYIIKNRI